MSEKKNIEKAKNEILERIAKKVAMKNGEAIVTAHSSHVSHGNRHYSH